VITDAIVPVAGLGTRLLPETRSAPNEMLPIVDKPIVQYVVEELPACLTSGTVHAPLRSRFDQGEPAVLETLAALGALAREARRARETTIRTSPGVA
jgi:hypothetical protein